MGKFKNKQKRNRRIPIIYQASVQQLVRGVLKHPFDVSMATLIVLCDVDPTISQLKDVQDFMSGLTQSEQEYAVMLEAALQNNKVQRTRMEEAVKIYNDETGNKLRVGDAGTDEGFAAWLPGYNDRVQAQWREENPEAAEAYDRQVAAQAQLDQGVGVLQATDPQGDVTPLIPADAGADNS